MGKSLIIKGADFSLNGIDISLKEATPVQGYIVTNPQNQSYGAVDMSGSGLCKNSILCKIPINSGKSMSVIVEDNGTRLTDLNMGYVASQNSFELSDDTVVTGIETNHHPADSLFRQSDGSFLVENSTTNDLYFYINICYNIASGPNFFVSGKHVFYKVVG